MDGLEPNWMVVLLVSLRDWLTLWPQAREDHAVGLAAPTYPPLRPAP